MHEVRFCNAPAYDEIGVKALYDKVIAQPGMAEYFPDKFPKGSQCCKTYMYNVWNTVHPEKVRAVLEYANNVRFSVDNDIIKKNTILITEEW